MYSFHLECEHASLSKCLKNATVQIHRWDKTLPNVFAALYPGGMIRIICVFLWLNCCIFKAFLSLKHLKW